MKIGIVLGYGLFSPERKDYRNYLDSITKRIHEDDLDKVVLCGGFTDPKQSNKSEAATIKDYLLSTNPDFNQYVLEEQSINTNQNLEFAAKEVNKDDEIFVYCDSTRLPKVLWIAAHYILDKSQTEIASFFLNYTRTGSGKIDINKPILFERIRVVSFDFPKEKSEIIAQIAASLVDIIALYNEKVKASDEKVRKEVFGL